MKNKQIISMSCDCPYALTEKSCKHMAAVLSFYEEQTTIDSCDSLKETASPNKKSMKQLVLELDEATLRHFLIETLKEDNALAQRFSRQFIKKETIQELTNEVDDIIETYSDWDGFIDYDQAYDFASELTDFLETMVTQLMDSKSYLLAFDLTTYLFQELYELEIDDSDGGITMLATGCCETWVSLSNVATLSEKQRMFQWFATELKGGHADYLEDYLEDVLQQGFNEKEFFDKKLLLTKEMCRKATQLKDWSKEYQLNKWAAWHIELLGKIEHGKEELEGFSKEYWAFNSVRNKYIQYCLNNRDYLQAERVLLESLELDKDHPGFVQEHHFQLKNLYKKTKNQEYYLNELWDLLLVFAPADVQVYTEMKGIYSNEEWPDVSAKIFSELKNQSGVDKLYLKEERYDLLMDYVAKSQLLYSAQQYFDLLKQRYPQQVAEKFEKEILRMSVEVSTRKNYQKIVQLIKKMATIPESMTQTQQLVETLRKTYNRRKAMMEELAKLSF